MTVFIRMVAAVERKFSVQMLLDTQSACGRFKPDRTGVSWQRKYPTPRAGRSLIRRMEVTAAKNISSY